MSEAEDRAQLVDQLITAEQDERRRLADFLHDTSVQSLSGIALMLDAALHAIENGQLEQAQVVVRSALERQRHAIRELRDLSFALEPVVLRDQGLAPAVRALAEQIGLQREIHLELDLDAADALAEKAQVALYQIIREALHGAVRRGPPTRVSIRVREDGAAVETVIADDAPGERRRATLEAIGERARAIGGRFELEHADGTGTVIRVRLPAYVAKV